MSNIKLSEGLFLEKQELDRFQRFIFDDGFKKHLLHNSAAFGLIRNKYLDPNFNWGKIQEGTNPQTIRINYTEALDRDGNLIVQELLDNQSIPNDGNWYWVRLSHRLTDREVGTVSIDATGNLVGINTKFTQILRGQPNFPSTISFLDSTNNILDYDVVEVIDDTNVVLNGAFTVESNLTYRVVGTFTPGKVPSGLEKGPFEYDDAIVDFIVETTIDQRPVNFLTDKQFALARVKIQGTQILIEDKREQIWQTLGQQEATLLTNTNNPLIGVESIRYDVESSVKTDSLINIAWAMRTTNWTVNPSLNVITIQSGVGGRYKNTGDFINGAFDGWRIYVPSSGEYFNIVSSIKSGSQINLTTDRLISKQFTDTTQQLIITPNVESIELLLKPTNGGPSQASLIYNFPINEGIAQLRAAAYQSSSTYEINYRYRTGNHYSPYRVLTGDTIGYYDEQQHDVLGNLITNPIATPYTTQILIKQHPKAYSIFADQVVTGDRFGIELTSLDNTNPIKQLQVGIDKQHQVFESILTLSTDHYVNLSTTDVKDGNKFILQFKKTIIPTTFKLTITQGFVNTGNVGTILKQFTLQDFRALNRFLDKGLVLECVFDNETALWQITPLTDVESIIDRSITQFRSTSSLWFEIAEVALPNTIELYEGLSLSFDVHIMTAGTSYSLKNRLSLGVVRNGDLHEADIFSAAGIGYNFTIDSGPEFLPGNFRVDETFRAQMIKNNIVDGVVWKIYAFYHSVNDQMIVTPVSISNNLNTSVSDYDFVTFKNETTGQSILSTLGVLVNLIPTHQFANLNSRIDSIRDIDARRSKTLIQDIAPNIAGGNTNGVYQSILSYTVPLPIGAAPGANLRCAVNLSCYYIYKTFEGFLLIVELRVKRNGQIMKQAIDYEQGRDGWYGKQLPLTASFPVSQGDVLSIEVNRFMRNNPFAIESEPTANGGYFLITAIDI